ncbi:Prostaglandin E synthase 2 [Coccomyxa sp. Obi]|nr:Prostaglandin E synthase 2 [Coccomyxa sp. Obi]
MASQTLRRLLTHRNLINRQHLPSIVTAASTLQDRVVIFETLSQQQPNVSRSGLTYLALGVLGAAAATGSTALAEPEIAAQSVRCNDPYSPPEELHGIPKEIILYQYEVCPFCCKVKAFLDFHKVPYRTIEVSPLTKKQLKWSDYRKVPVVLLDGEPVTDSTAIITRLAAEVAEQERQHHASQAQASSISWKRLLGGGTRTEEAAQSPGLDRVDEERWRRWVDERLVRLLTVNIYRNMRESFQTFDYITASSCNFSFVEREAARVVGAVLMWGISGRLKKKYGIEGDVRAELYQAASEWVDALGERRFHGGAEPDLADLSVFGVIRSITCTDTFMDLMHTTRIGPWYEHMMDAVGKSSRLSAS